MPPMSRRAALLVMLAAACGPKVPTTMEPEVDPPGPVAHASTIETPEPIVQISLIVRDVAGLYLFEDEQLEAATIIATWAKTTNLTLEPPARTREIMRRAANGQDASSGKACGSPLWSLPALERWREDIAADGRLEVLVACLPNCVLAVTASEGLDAAARDAGRTALWTAPFDPAQPWRTELARRLAEVRTAQIGPDVGVATPGAAPRPAVTDPAFAAVDEEPLPDVLATRARACLGDVGAIGLVLETDARGQIARCENWAGRIVANGPVAACACTALGAASLGGGARRLATTVTLPESATTVMTKAGKVVVAHLEPALKRDAGSGAILPIVTDRSVREWEPPAPWSLARCFVDLAPAAGVEARVMIVVDGATGAVSVGDLQVSAGSLTPAQSTCLGEVISRATRIPCPAPGRHAISAKLAVRQRDP